MAQRKATLTREDSKLHGLSYWSNQDRIAREERLKRELVTQMRTIDPVLARKKDWQLFPVAHRILTAEDPI